MSASSSWSSVTRPENSAAFGWVGASWNIEDTAQHGSLPLVVVQCTHNSTATLRRGNLLGYISSCGCSCCNQPVHAEFVGITRLHAAAQLLAQQTVFYCSSVAAPLATASGYRYQPHSTSAPTPSHRDTSPLQCHSTCSSALYTRAAWDLPPKKASLNTCHLSTTFGLLNVNISTALGEAVTRQAEQGQG